MKYVGVYNRGEFVRGDVIPALTVRLNPQEPLVPESAWMEILDAPEHLSLLQARVQEDGFCVFPDFCTSDLELSRYEFRIRFQLPNGVVKTYLKGTFKVRR